MNVASTGPPDTRRPSGWRARWSGFAGELLRTPLPWKILLANTVILTVAGGAALVVAHQLAGGSVTAMVVAVSLVFTLAIFLAGALVNAVVLRLALTPHQLLVSTADRVSRGEYRARVPESPLADRSTERLVSVFNRMLDSVQSSHDRQQELALRVLQAEERERARIAHELYAGTAQTLAGVLVRLRVAARQNETVGGRVAAGVGSTEEIRSELTAALEEVRGIARRLRPPELDELGILPALEAHARVLTEGRPLRVRIQGHVPESCLSRDAALALFRIGQEALTNAVLHSGGQRVDLRFSARSNGLVMEVSDDGRGFDVRDLLTGPEPHLGVTGMRERAVYVGGTFAIDSEDGGGTRVHVMVPWAGEARPAAASSPELSAVA